MEVFAILLLPLLMFIVAVTNCDLIGLTTKKLSDECSAMSGEIIRLSAKVEELAGVISEASSQPKVQNEDKMEDRHQEEETKKVRRPNRLDSLNRNHFLSDIELACEIVRKDPREIPDREKRYVGLVFTDLEDTYFFDQLMAQNQDLKDTIEDSMRKFMSGNMKLEPKNRFYVPNRVYEKYMTTNEY